MEINYLAVLVAAIASMVLGAWWFSPAGFGKAWMKEMGFTKEDMEKAKKKGMGKSYAIMFVGSLVMAGVLDHVITVSQQVSDFPELKHGLIIGFGMWLGFIATVGLGMVLWNNKSWKLYCITMGYWLVLLLVMGGILSSWS